MSDGVELRSAVEADARLLFGWANDPETRRWSFETSTIDWPVHEEWLRSVLTDPRRELWVAEVDGRPVGQVRLDSEGDHHVISVSVAPDQRGRGLARRTIDAACARARLPVRANIGRGNDRSIAAFKAAGFVDVTPADGRSGISLTFEWQPPRPSRRVPRSS